MSPKEVAAKARVSANAVRYHCLHHGLGRRVFGRWQISDEEVRLILEGRMPSRAGRDGDVRSIT